MQTYMIYLHNVGFFLELSVRYNQRMSSQACQDIDRLLVLGCDLYKHSY